LGIHVESESDDVDIPRTLSLAQKTAFDAIGTSKKSEFSGSDTTTAIIVWMSRKNAVLALADVGRKIFNLTYSVNKDEGTKNGTTTCT